MKNKDILFNYNQDLQQPANDVKNIRTTKTKFLRDLNYKNATGPKTADRKVPISVKIKQHQQSFVKNPRIRQQSFQQMDSLLQRAIPGAKILKGEWKDHKLSGNVMIQYDNGSTFEGKYQNGLKIQGKMIYSQANCQYQGGFFGQKFSGYGKLTYYEGRIIEGQWDNMQFIGNATITYPNGDVYYGPVDENLYKHGQGYIFLNNGYKYIGMFKNGSITGVGSYLKDQKLIIKGLWQKGKLIKELTTDDFDSVQSNLNVQLAGYKEAKKAEFKNRTNNYNQTQQSLDSISQKSSILLLKQKQRHFINDQYE